MSNPVPSSLALTTIAGNVSASPLNSDYGAIQTAVNALITALGGGTVGQALQAIDSTHVQWAGGTYLAPPQKYGTLIDVVSSVAETDILQAAGYAIPGNTLGATGVARVTLCGDYLNNTGGNANINPLKVIFGGTTINLGSTWNVSASASRRGFFLQFTVGNRGATNSQAITGFGTLGAAGPAAFDKLDASGNDGQGIDVFGTAAVDTTSSQTLRVTATLSSSSASHELRVFHSLIEFI